MGSTPTSGWRNAWSRPPSDLRCCQTGDSSDQRSAIAGGMELVQGTDLRIASTDAKFGVQEVKWAIFQAAVRR